MIDRGDPVVLGDGVSAGASGGLTVTSRGAFMLSSITVVPGLPVVCLFVSLCLGLFHVQTHDTTAGLPYDTRYW